MAITILDNKLKNYRKILGNRPDQKELDRLVKYYQTYEWPHRNALLVGYFEDKGLKQLVDDKLIAKQKNKLEQCKESLGGESTWVIKKVERTLIRLLFLRLHFDEAMTRRKANAELLKIFPSDKAKDAGQRRIRHATQFRTI